MKTSYLFLSNGFEEIEAVTIIDILRRAKIDLKIVSMGEERAVIGEHGITLMADVLYSKTKWGITLNFLFCPEELVVRKIFL